MIAFVLTLILPPIFICNIGVAATKDHDIGTTNLHIEVSDVVNILVYVGIAKGNGVLSKSGKARCR